MTDEGICLGYFERRAVSGDFLRAFMFPINARFIKIIEFQISFFTITVNIQVFLLKLLLVFT